MAGLMVLALGLAGCATPPGGIYAPRDGGERVEEAPEPPRTDTEQRDSVKLSEQPPEEQEQRSTPTPSYQEQGADMSPAAASLVDRANTLLAQGNAQGAVSQLERAQRISPRSAEVYLRLAEAYVAIGNTGAAEQFILKSLSLAGDDTRLQREGWLLLAEIRRDRGDVAGADQAEKRAGQL